jgi:phenylglyoxylate dehydrogenase delta subunit
MKKQSHPMFDKSTIPDDLCPIATDFMGTRVGDWRARRPVVKQAKCVKCGVCWAFCPTQTIVEHPQWFEPSLENCKGCGICAEECPHDVIVMVVEQE